MKPVAGPMVGLLGAAATALVIGLTALSAPRPAEALPTYAQQTKLACGRCHVSAAGGGALTAFGKAFAANGHKLPATAAKPGKSSKGNGASPAAVPAEISAPAPVFALDYAQAQAWSLRHPYYSHFLYSPDDYRN